MKEFFSWKLRNVRTRCTTKIVFDLQVHCQVCNLCNSSTFISLPLRYLRTLLSASLKTSKFWKPTLVHHYLVKVRTSFFHKVKQKIETVITHFHDMICSWSINKMNTLAIASILRCFQISYFSTDFQMITFRKYNKTSNQNYLDPTASVWKQFIILTPERRNIL